MATAINSEIRRVVLNGADCYLIILKKTKSDKSNHTTGKSMTEKHSDQVGTKHIHIMNKMAQLSSQKPKINQPARKGSPNNPKWDGPDLPTIEVNATRLGGKSVCKGGHPRYTMELSSAETRYIEHSAITAEANHTPLNCMATVHKRGVGLNKRPYQDFIKSLIRKFNQYGWDLYGISIYERRRFDEVEDREMHLHLWFHCPSDLLDVINIFVDGGSDQRTDRQFSKAHKGTFGYLTKCHASMEPSMARRLRNRPAYKYYNRQYGDFIKGRRFHLTTPLHRIVDLPYPPSIRVMPKPKVQKK
jgi:hypothetical protein